MVQSSTVSHSVTWWIVRNSSSWFPAKGGSRVSVEWLLLLRKKKMVTLSPIQRMREVEGECGLRVEGFSHTLGTRSLENGDSNGKIHGPKGLRGHGILSAKPKPNWTTGKVLELWPMSLWGVLCKRAILWMEITFYFWWLVEGWDMCIQIM